MSHLGGLQSAEPQRERQIGACAAVMVVTGCDWLSGTIAASLLDRESAWLLPSLGAAAFVFGGAQLYRRGLRYALYSVACIALYNTVRFGGLMFLMDIPLNGSYLPGLLLHAVTIAVLLRLRMRPNATCQSGEAAFTNHQ